METIRAAFDGCELLVVERSLALPEPPNDQNFLGYLNNLSASGWRGVDAYFEKVDLVLHVEQLRKSRGRPCRPTWCR